MHEVQTFSFLVVPPRGGVRTDCLVGSQRRFVRRCEWDTLWPKPGPLPQTSHTLATGYSWLTRTELVTRSEGAQRASPGQPGKVTRCADATANRPDRGAVPPDCQGRLVRFSRA